MQNNARTAPAAPGLNFGDILYVLFRHKKKIIFLSLLGIGGALAMYFTTKVLYESEAKLFVKYVQDHRAFVAPGAEATDPIKTPDSGGQGIINSEIQIITSLDVATEVVDALTIDKILPKENKVRTREAAAVYIQNHLIVPPQRGDVIDIRFQHPDASMVQPVLTQVIENYFKKHYEVHRMPGVSDDFLREQTEVVRGRLSQTEDELRKLKIKAGVVSLDEARTVYLEEVSRLRQQLHQAEAELNERQTVLREMTKLTSQKPDAAKDAPSILEASAVPIPAEKVVEYKRIVARLDALYKREEDLRTRFTDQHLLVKEVRQSIDENETIRKKLEEESPRLLAENPASSKSQTNALDLNLEKARIAALATKVQFLTKQYEKARGDIGAVDEIESNFSRLQREKDVEETQYRNYAAGLQQARIESVLSVGKLSNSNISQIQAPSPPFRATSESFKRIGMTAGGGIFGGIALAFLCELFLDQSVKRSRDIEGRLRLSAFLTIPAMKGNRRRKALSGKPKKLIADGADSSASSGVPAPRINGSSAEIAPWDEEHPLHPFFETLRDRLMTFFEVRNLTHKPKLIAVTGCSRGAGVTTIAAALAASLSETGEGNVLLVDMNVQNGAAHPFYKGKPSRGLEDVLEHQNRETALVQEKLYMVKGETADDRLPRILPKRFAGLLPKLKASDYDYIIFDMPSVTQTSITPRLAGFMDAVLLVLESEKTDGTVAERAAALLAESKANTLAVLNKTHAYVPRRLQQEF